MFGDYHSNLDLVYVNPEEFQGCSVKPGPEIFETRYPTSSRSSSPKYFPCTELQQTVSSFVSHDVGILVCGLSLRSSVPSPLFIVRRTSTFATFTVQLIFRILLYIHNSKSFEVFGCGCIECPRFCTTKGEQNDVTTQESYFSVKGQVITFKESVHGFSCALFQFSLIMVPRQLYSDELFQQQLGL